MKTYFAEHIGVKPENIYTVSIMPCMAKKGEANMELFHEEYAGHDVDAVLTTREFERMIRSAHILPELLDDMPCDPLMQEGTGAGVIFGTTGGVMEAAIRSAYYLVNVRIRMRTLSGLCAMTGQSGCRRQPCSWRTSRSLLRWSVDFPTRENC